MSYALWVRACVIGLGGCKRSAPPDAPPRPAPEQHEEPAHTGQTSNNADVNLRVLLAQIAEARACAQVRNTYHGLRAETDPDMVVGELWLRTCHIDARGTEITFHFDGDGWQRVDRSIKKIGATFAVHDYVRYHVSATLFGTVDFAYAPEHHVATVWFKPTKAPEVKFEPNGKVPVDEHGLWSSIIGTIATIVGQAPEKKAGQQVATQGQQAFVSKLDDGMTITVNACTGSARSQFGILGQGKMAPADIGDTMKVGAELHRGGVMIFGPEYVPRSFAIDVRASRGPVHVDVACLAEANHLSDAYLANQRPLPKIKTLVSADVSDRRKLEIPKTTCPVAVIAQSEAGTVSMSWTREPPPGAGLVDCPPEARSETAVPHAPATPRNTPAVPPH